MAKAMRYKNTEIPRQPGELARLKVIQGVDAGALYVITANRVSIGRGDENEVVLADMTCSRVHAVMTLTPLGWLLEDQGSSNGILVDGKSSRKVSVKMGTVFVLGSTAFEFVSSDAPTSILMAPGKSPAQLELDRQRLLLLNQRSESIRQDAIPQFGMSHGTPSANNPGRVLLYTVGAIALLVLFFANDPTSNPESGRKPSSIASPSSTGDTNLATYLPKTPSNASAERIFKDGLREFFSGNYNRARTQFETVLQINPSHGLARLYLEKCAASVKDEVKTQLSFGKKALEAGKLRDAKSRFDRVMRLLYKDQANPSYIEAKEQYQKVVEQLKTEGDTSL